jgi:hypothetical protein
MKNKLQWYGYQHINDTIHLKRYMNDYGDIVEARASDFVKHCTNSFYADTKKEALHILRRKIIKKER